MRVRFKEPALVPTNTSPNQLTHGLGRLCNPLLVLRRRLAPELILLLHLDRLVDGACNGGGESN